MTLNDIHALVTDELTAIDRLLRDRMRSEVPLVQKMGHYLAEAGGKRLRAVLVVLSSRVLGGPCDAQASLLLATAIEFIHAATLLHDDVVDDSDQRRGRDTANRIWDNEASVLMGDFLYSRAFDVISEINLPAVTRTLATASSTIAEGELLELMYAGQPDLGEARYLEIAESKTARLFEASCEASARIEQAGELQVSGLKEYGRCLGVAFQITDDAIDYLRDNPEADKDIGDDLASGRMTLPYIYALHHSDAADRKFLEQAIRDGRRDAIDRVCTVLHDSGAIDAAQQQADGFAEQACAQLAALAPSPARDALEAVARFAVARRH